MAFFDTTRPAAGRRAGLIATLYAEFLAWREVRRTQNALADLSDHELADIGLQRSDIEDMTRKAFGLR